MRPGLRPYLHKKITPTRIKKDGNPSRKSILNYVFSKRPSIRARLDDGLHEMSSVNMVEKQWFALKFKRNLLYTILFILFAYFSTTLDRVRQNSKKTYSYCKPLSATVVQGQ